MAARAPGPAVGALLERLPDAGEAVDERLALSGFLLRSPRGEVRVVTGGLCLTFAAQDVIEAAERSLPDGLEAGGAIPVRMSVRRGARLLGVGPADPYQPSLVRSRLPFAMRVRDAPPVEVQTPRYQALEASFRRRHGLEP